MEPLILIPPQTTAATSNFQEIIQQVLPATLQADGLQTDETVKVNSGSGFAVGTLTLTLTPIVGDTVTLGSKTYTWVAAALTVDGEVEVGTSADDSIDNLVAAINLGPGAGTDYGSETTLNDAASAENAGSDTMLAIAKAVGEPGTVQSTQVMAAATWGATTLVFPSPPQILLQTAVAVELTLDNNIIAINSPLTIQVVKSITANAVGVTLALGSDV